MKVYLLYPQKEWLNPEPYFDEKAIVQDLGLKTLFLAAAKEVVKEDGKVKRIREADLYLEETMKKVVMVPVEAEEILYRQEILRDCLQEENFIRSLYELACDILDQWDRLGRRAGRKAGEGSPRVLVTKIHVLQLFVTGLSRLKRLLEEYGGKHYSRGFLALQGRLQEEFSDGMERTLKKILQDVAFYANEKEHTESVNAPMENRPRILAGCSVGDGLKLCHFRLQDVATDSRKYQSSGGNFLERAQEYLGIRGKNVVYVNRDASLGGQTDLLEYTGVEYIVSCCEPFFKAFEKFFDQLRFQAAFYRGAVNLRAYLERFQLPYCYPAAGSGDCLKFRELKEFVMSIEQKMTPVGNTCDIEGKSLLVVTGANQGGKSTFLRSVGIAQVMFQCGLMVAAEHFESGVFPFFFTHFTRREDSAMNSGRLDEELGRMSQIIDHLGQNSMILLNESFASTTEKEGSVIVYDIVRALTEAGVKVLTVTHLLSFARKVYQEALQDPDFGAVFLSAQRMEGGRRTYKMIAHAPELTSFGLDLYDEVIGGGGADGNRVGQRS